MVLTTSVLWMSHILILWSTDPLNRYFSLRRNMTRVNNNTNNNNDTTHVNNNKKMITPQYERDLSMDDRTQQHNQSQQSRSSLVPRLPSAHKCE